MPLKSVNTIQPEEGLQLKPLSPKTWQALQETIDLAKQRKTFQSNDHVDWKAVEQHARHTFESQNVPIDDKTLMDAIEYSKTHHDSSWALKPKKEAQENPIETTLEVLSTLNLSTPEQAWKTYLVYHNKWQKKYRAAKLRPLIFNKYSILMTCFWLGLSFINSGALLAAVAFVGTSSGLALFFHWLDKRNDAKWLKNLKKTVLNPHSTENQFPALLYFLISAHLNIGNKKAEHPSTHGVEHIYLSLLRTKHKGYPPPKEHLSPELFISKIILRPSIPFYFQQQLGKILKGWMQQEGGLNFCHYLLLDEVANELESYFVREEKEHKYMEAKQSATNQLNTLLNL